jgi:NAD(P)-dependent dehydrogenase (short-subunit alcohol dehydrogenase family)
LELLEGRVVIVTGAGRGIGREHVLDFARRGALVVVNDADIVDGGEGVAPDSGAGSSAAQQVAAEVTAAGGTAIADTTSVTDFDGIGRLVDRTVARFGRLDAVVNNAGIMRDRMITSMSENEFDSVISVHLKGTWNVTHHACSHWRAQVKRGEAVHGRILNTTSGSGLLGNVGQSNYGPAKAGVASLTIITAMEMARYGVTANAISPLARTRMTKDVASMWSEQTARWDRFDPANSSPVAAWLCSEASGWLSGSVLRVDGNRIQRMVPWSLDPLRVYEAPEGSPIDAGQLDRHMRIAFEVLPGGLVSSPSSPVGQSVTKATP